MGRKLQIDINQSLDKATKTFWQNGYKNTSTQELMKVMNVGEGSFYNTFKSKKNLYLQCLQYYNQNLMKNRSEALNSNPSIKVGLREFFDVVFLELADKKNPNSCLMANSLSTDVLDEIEFKEYILDSVKRFQNFLKEKMQSGIESGELPKDFDAETTSKILFTYMQGLFRTSSINPDIKVLKKQTHKFLESMGL